MQIKVHTIVRYLVIHHYNAHRHMQHLVIFVNRSLAYHTSQKYI